MNLIKPVDTLNNRTKIINDINNERNRQNLKWGKQVHDYSYWYAILGEEFGEVGQAIQKGSVAHKSTDADNLYKELIQVAAVATAMAEQILEE
ncbi:MazG-like family protein [Oceanobacillus profundus]|uniref:MazG-like family protein n=1 Tax=Oceanobacillus TaxID=182709 RepID=UPI0026E46EA6|nr:MazG-like family protein [Oceanobacillus profundus]MDO6448106.1 MazG-like family protein [Oceanobacillus profundus]